MGHIFKPKQRKKKKTHGFLVRKRTAGGQRTIKRRRQKNRSSLTP